MKKTGIIAMALTGIGVIVSIAQGIVSTKMMNEEINEAVEKRLGSPSNEETAEEKAE